MAVAVGLEAGVLALGAVAVVVELFVADAASVPRALFLAGLAALGGAGMGAVAVGLARGLRWSRAPAATWQVIQAAVAIPALGTSWTVPAALALTLGVIVVLGVLQARLFGDLPSRG